ncbi:MAG TPA: TlpA disulfide reductase family protein [Thermoanaerobaculia bacterium]|jgi:thiol-disulfide isomerase/thioredoxin|nr:TlpA disulfide reductase family protein [Thermoanaerobaculia bacterium]
MKKTFAVALSLMLVAAVACRRAEKAESPAKPNASKKASKKSTTPMPEYTALNLDGTKFDLAKRRDKAVLLNVWATWCGPCREEIPELQKLHDHYGPRGFEVIGVSVDESGVDSVKEFISKQEKMAYPIVLDAEGRIANLLQTSVLPTTILVNRDGEIVWKKFGPVSGQDQELTKAIEASL